MSKIKDELESPAMDQSLDEIIPKWNVKVHRNIFRQCYMAGYEGGMAEARTEIETWKDKYIEARRSGYEEGLSEAKLEIERIRAMHREIFGPAGHKHIGDIIVERNEARALLSRMAELAQKARKK